MDWRQFQLIRAEHHDIQVLCIFPRAKAAAAINADVSTRLFSEEFGPGLEAASQRSLPQELQSRLFGALGG